MPRPSKPSPTESILSQLQTYESRNTTWIDPQGGWPIVWKRARGNHVWDVEGKRYTDFTAAFGVAAAGHANPRVVRAGQSQMTQLLHAMGDVHPHPGKAALAEALVGITWERWTRRKTSGKVLFTNSGFEAVEAALKTARLATRKPGVIAFTGAYHGLGYGTLNAAHRPMFRQPFENQLAGFVKFATFPTVDLAIAEKSLRNLLVAKKNSIGAILVEPIQARGGIRIPPIGFLPLLRSLATEFGVLLILDEIYTGFGRTGRWFACEHSQTVPDLICVGKALAGGFPISACVGRSELMDQWPESQGEALHTSTFLGHPVGCAMALAQLKEIKRLGLVQASEVRGRFFLQALQQLPSSVQGVSLKARGVGLMLGLELTKPNGQPASIESLRTVKQLLHRGFIVLPEGEHGNVIGLTPPLTINDSNIRDLVHHLGSVLETVQN